VPDHRPLDAAALPLRPADEARMEGAAAPRARERDADRRRDPLGRRAPRVSGALFLVVAALTIACALLVLLHRSRVYSAIGLVGALGQIAVLFLALDAQIVGFLQIIVYAGAIVVLFLFVIMLLNLQEEPEAFGPGSLVAVAITGGVGLTI